MARSLHVLVGVSVLLAAACSRVPAPSKAEVGTAPASSAAPAAPVSSVSSAERARESAKARENAARKNPKNSNGTWKDFPRAPADLPQKTLLLAYDDFGPQALAGRLLGQDCYSFGECCCMELGDRFDVRVVVTDGISKEAANARYVTGPETGDYRVVTKAEALAFLREALRDQRSWSAEDRIPTLEATLAKTEARITSAFAKPAASR